MNISFFAFPRETKIPRLAHYFPYGMTGEIRAKQMAKYLKAKLNPIDGYQDDVCIWVKTIPTEDFPKHSYLDIMDGYDKIEWLKKHPNIGVIAASVAIQKYLTKELKRDNIFFIPQHHCNYNREIRQEREVTTVGIIGKSNRFEYSYENKDDIKQKFKDIGLTLNQKIHMRGRKSVVRWYKTIDIQIVWRPYLKGLEDIFRIPLKIINAGSFGIPTVAFPESNFNDEWGGCFLPANSIDELIEQVKRLKDDPELYRNISLKAIEVSEKYHIEHIANLYRSLMNVASL